MRAGQTPGMSRGVLDGGQAVVPGAVLAGDRQARPDKLRLSRGGSVRVYPGGFQDQAYIGIRFRDGHGLAVGEDKNAVKGTGINLPRQRPGDKVRAHRKIPDILSHLGRAVICGI